jgi:hypothetical protein
MPDDLIDPMSPEYWNSTTSKDEDPLSTEHFHHITILEEPVLSPGTYPRRFDFMPAGMFDKPREVSVWQVILGDLGFLVCEHTIKKTNKALFKAPNFTELFKDFEGMKAQMKEQGVEPPEPVICWLRGLIHAFMAENPNVIQCEAVLTGTSGVG